MSTAALHGKALDIVWLSTRMTALAGSGHPSSAASIAHLVAHLLHREMRYDPADPGNPAGDRLVLSQGHAVPAVYAAYAGLGGAVARAPGDRGPLVPLTVAELDRLRAIDSVLDGHPNPAEGFPFFDSATGSLGMGLSVAAGLAIAARLDGTPRRVFAIIGDGESREGQIWEAADFIVDHRLSHVCAIFNCNGQGQAGNVSGQQSASRLAAKLEAFGWKVESIDGHDPAQVASALSMVGKSERPLAIVARTVKGWGLEMLQKGNWHGKPPAAADLPAIEASIAAERKRLGAAGDLGRPPAAGRGSARVKRVEPESAKWPPLADVLRAAGMEGAFEKRLLSTRRAYGAALRAAGDLLPQLVCLDADVSNSTFAEIFARAFPQRFFECKIAEQNMLSTAAGLSAAGFLPVVNSFAKFFARAYDQIELASISRANVKIVGSHSGISLAADGPSQMAVADAAFFRAFTTARADDGTSPLAWFYQPADAVCAVHCTRDLLSRSGMCYMRTHRPDVPFLYEPDAPFDATGFNVLRDGGDLALIASGYMVHVARQAADELSRGGRRVGLIDAWRLPLDSAALLTAIGRCGGRALVVEDNYGGGFGSAVAEAAAAAGGARVQTLTCGRMPRSARTAEEILDYCGVGVRQIVERAQGMAAAR